MCRTVLVAFACAASAVGCSLLTSLDGLSNGGAPSTLPSEGSTEDATAQEGGESDGGADSGDASDAAAVDPCVGAVFCDHFERDLVQGDWSNLFTDFGGAASLDTSTFTSPAKSLALHVPSPANNNNPHAQLSSMIYDNVAHARVSFSMKSSDPDRQMSLMRLQLSESDRSEVFDLFMLPGKYVMNEQGLGAANAGYFEYSVQSAFKPNAWQRWTIELDATGAIAVGIVVVDGQEIIRQTLRNAFRRSSFGVLLGAYYAPAGPAHDVSYDDVSITILP